MLTNIPDNKDLSSDKNITKINFFKKWEFLLFIILILVLLVDYIISPQLFIINNLASATISFMERSIIAIPLGLLIMTGYIDISVASIAALSSVMLAYTWKMGFPFWLSIVIGFATGTIAGLINGLLTTKIKIPSLVATLANLILYSGICSVLLGDEAIGNFPKNFGYFGGAYNLLPVPNSLIIFFMIAIVFGIILHFTTFGRSIYAIGNNENAARYSGIAVDRIRIVLYTVTGFVCALSGILYTSRVSNVRSDMLEGAELGVITIILLGGVYIFGGRGSIIGIILAAFSIGFIQYTLRLINIKDVVISIVTGCLLIITLLIPRFNDSIKDFRMKKRFLQKR